MIVSESRAIICRIIGKHVVGGVKHSRCNIKPRFRVVPSVDIEFDMSARRISALTDTSPHHCAVTHTT